MPRRTRSDGATADPPQAGGELFPRAAAADAPLAERLRPHTIDEVIGQSHLLGPGKPLRVAFESGRPHSMIFWGPPGVGKTTLARLMADAFDAQFIAISAVLGGVKDIREAVVAAQMARERGRRTILFVDEVHRFNKAQQDAFLPHVESGLFTFIGATTENPSFEVNGALLSRCQVFVLRRLGHEELDRILERAESETGRKLPLTPDARAAVCAMADGDGRYLLNLAEELFTLDPATPLDPVALTERIQKRAPLYDKTQEAHYNLISALHKALRGSDADAALYWLARMLAGGEDPRYIARRLTRFAVEDIGLADPDALPQSIAAWEAYERIGSPEGELAIAQCVLYLATAPKSNAAYKALGSAMRAAKETGSLAPPMHILNAPTGLMKDLGYGDGYVYDHDTEEGFSGQNYFPDDMERRVFYRPAERGFEREVKKRLDYWSRMRERPEGKKD